MNQSTPTLAQRLETAVRVEQPLRARVVELEAALQAAIDATEFGAAAAAKRDLGPAREQLAIAEAETASLRTAQQRIDAQRAADDETVRRHQQAAADRQIVDGAGHREQAARKDISDHRAEIRRLVGLLADQMQLMGDADQRVTAARYEAYLAQVRLGERQAGELIMPFNAARSLLDQNPALATLVRGGLR